jgi:hypothetical protein
MRIYFKQIICRDYDDNAQRQAEVSGEYSRHTHAPT